MKIPLIIWSRYRPAQLELLLRSIKVCAKDIFSINIIYKVDKEYLDGYNKVKGKYNQPFWIQELDGQNFGDITKYTIDNIDSEYISFATDDSVLYRTVDKDILKKILPSTESCVTSLRLGYNTIVQDVHAKTVQQPLNVAMEHEDWIEWPISYYHPNHNYGYPFSLDFHVFRQSLIKDLVSNLDFNNSSELEGQLTQFRNKIDYIRSPLYSCAVNIPVNTAGGYTRAGEINPATLEELNKKFMDGYIIDLMEICKNNIIGCHQEVNFEFIKAN